jgi:hypothetical protein
MTLQEFIYNTSIDPKYYVFLSVQIPDKRSYVHNFKIEHLWLKDIYDEYIKPTSIVDHIYFKDDYVILIDLINKGDS